jgi:hypothetical protein
LKTCWQHKDSAELMLIGEELGELLRRARVV